ncbi:MAG TPA: hypothetical protein VJI96_02320 [Candidatus Andersenbacteria bacterium]|nr:hypothetical protein [Candidatus Andersenbacteria bacterium]
MRHSIRVIWYTLAIIFLMVTIGIVHTKVIVLWKEVARRQEVLQDVPAQERRTDALQKELDAATADMQVLYGSAPTREGLVDVIAAISQAAAISGISVQVPTVKVNSTSPTPIPKTSVSPLPQNTFSDVRIHIVGAGDIAALASFLYRVEHLPYILRIASWKIETMAQSSASSFVGTAPSDSKQVLPPVNSSLVADLVIVVRDTHQTP